MATRKGGPAFACWGSHECSNVERMPTVVQPRQNQPLQTLTGEEFPCVEKLTEWLLFDGGVFRMINIVLETPRLHIVAVTKPFTTQL